MKILNKFACWFNAKWGWFFTNGNKAYSHQAPRRGEVHYEIGNGWAGWFVIETIQDPKRKQVQCYYHPLHYLQEGKFEEGQTVFFVNKCDAPKECEFVWITGLC